MTRPLTSPRLALLVLLSLLTLGSGAHAHDARPLALSIHQQGDGLYRAELTIPPSVERFNLPRIQWPETCSLASEGIAGRGVDGRWQGLIACPSGLEGQSLDIVYPYYNPSLSTVIQLIPRNGDPVIAVLPPQDSVWKVPEAPSFTGVAMDYIGLGMSHILGGIDHLFFVAGLLFLARTGRRVLIVVTGFTLAHSITLSLSALGFVSVPVPPTEAAIALSILFLASELARGETSSLAFRFPAAVSFVFGLLHGLGFAAALSDIGLPEGHVTTALLFFNLGVEAGQIAVVLPLFGLLWLGARLLPRLLVSPFARGQTLAGYALGLPAAVWFIDRLSGV